MWNINIYYSSFKRIRKISSACMNFRWPSKHADMARARHLNEDMVMIMIFFSSSLLICDQNLEVLILF